MKNKLYILFVFLLCCSVLYAENIHLKVGDIRTLSPSVLSSKVLGLPTKSEFEELINACIWTWEERNGTTSGYKVTGPSGESIFLPTTGYRINDNLFESFIGYYWTGTLQSTNRIYPYVLNFDDNHFGLNVNVDGYLAYPMKYFGCAVSPVQDY